MSDSYLGRSVRNLAEPFGTPDLVADALAPKPTPSIEDVLDGPTIESILDAPSKPKMIWEDPTQILKGENWDTFLTKSAPGRMLSAFGAGVVQGWGTRTYGLEDEPEGVLKTPNKDLKQLLRDTGFLNDYQKGQQTLIKSFNEGLLRSAAFVGDVALRSLSATVYGLGGLAVASGVPRDIPGHIEAFPAGGMTGLPVRPRVGSPVPGEAFTRNLELERILDDADTLGLLPQEAARRAFAPEQPPVRDVVAAAPEGAPVVEALTPEVAAPLGDPDVHGMARALEPGLFREWDALQARRERFLDWMEELRDAREEIPALKRAREQEAVILGRVRGVEERLTNRARERLAEARAAIDEATSADSPDMARVRRALQETDFRMRDLAEDVSGAYRMAREELPPPEMLPPETILEATRPVEALAPEAQLDVTSPREIANLAQRRPGIAREIQRVLEANGRPREEARAGGAILSAYYEARAARLGTNARALFDEDAPRIVSGEGATRGRFTFAEPRNIITLLSTADASTFMHESAHQWLVDMLVDSQRPQVPQQFLDDVNVVRQWLGVDGAPTRAQHEKFARGFERYLMEGVAPSTQLARVFEQFKEWLTRIYETVARLRSPITDEIRGVYDRLLTKPRETTVVEERPRGDPLREAERVRPEEAEATADALREARDRDISEAVEEAKRRAFDGERRRARGGPARTGVAERGGDAGGPIAGGEGVAAPITTVSSGRTPPSGTSRAPASSTDPFQSIGGTFLDAEGKIRLENLFTPDDVNRALREQAELGAGLAERRGAVTDAQVADLAKVIALRPEELFVRDIGKAYSAEELKAFKNVIIAQSSRFHDAAAKAAAGGEREIVAYAIERERMSMLIDRMLGARAEAGRALRTFRDIAGIDVELITELLQRGTGRSPTELRREASFATAMYTPEQAASFVRSKTNAKWYDKVIEAWTSNLLGISTVAWNTLGNVSTLVRNIPETAYSELRGGEPRGATADAIYAIGPGSVRGAKAAWEIIKNEEVIDESLRPLDVAHPRAIEHPVGGQIARLGFRASAIVDALFKGIAFQQELMVQARLHALEEGLTGDRMSARIDEYLRDPTEGMIEKAEAFARYQTFTNPLGRTGQHFQAMVADNPGLRPLFPFIRTPTNIFKYELERTPLGLVSRRIRDELRSDDPRVARAAEARLVLGTTALAAAAYFAMQGGGPWDAWITGNGPPAEDRQVWDRTGYKPNSFRFGNLYLPYYNIPGAMSIGMIADMVALWRQAPQAMTDGEMDRLVWTAIANLGKDVANIVPIRGALDVMNAIQDPGRYGGQYVDRMAGSIVPSAVNELAAWNDPMMRDARGIIDTWRERTGIQRDRVPPKIDIWGQPILRSERGTETNDPVANWLARSSIGIAQPARKLDGVTLTGQQYAEMAQVRGRFIKETLALAQRSGIEQQPLLAQQKVVQNAIEAGTKMGEAYIRMKYMGSADSPLEKAIELKTKKFGPAPQAR